MKTSLCKMCNPMNDPEFHLLLCSSFVSAIQLIFKFSPSIGTGFGNSGKFDMVKCIRISLTQDPTLAHLYNLISWVFIDAITLHHANWFLKHKKSMILYLKISWFKQEILFRNSWVLAYPHRVTTLFLETPQTHISSCTHFIFAPSFLLITFITRIVTRKQ